MEKPTREELLLRFEKSKERLHKRLAEIEIRARELFKERPGEFKTQDAIEEMRNGETITCDGMDDYLKLVDNELLLKHNE